VTYRGQYGDRGAWQPPQGQQQQSAYRPGPEQWGQYPPGPRPGGYSPALDAQPPAEPQRHGGAEGNERLTVMTGAVLLILLAAEGFTILSLGRMLTLHFFIGMLLLGPVVLKAGSVTYRFFRYYTGSAPYVRKGPPALLLRLLGPFLMLLTASVFGSGVMLALVGPSGRQPWLFVHKAAFILWFGAMAIHVLAYLPRLPRLLYAEARGVDLPQGGGPRHAASGRPAARPASRAAQIIGGRRVRLSLLLASLAAGLVIALLTVHLAGAWENPGQIFFNG
jgi:hypothetical protein